MSNNKKRAGQSTFDMADKRYRSRLWFLLGIFGVVVVILVIASKAISWGLGIFGFLGLIILARLLMDFMDVREKSMRKEERRAFRGAKAEVRIGSILDGIGTDYMVLHDIVSPYGNIDHVVITRQGRVFLIETKAHGGRVSVSDVQLLVNGKPPEKDFIAQVLNNTYWLREKLQAELNSKVWIIPILVFSNAFVERSAPIKGIRVLNKKYLQGTVQELNSSTENGTLWERREAVERLLSGT